MTYKPNEIWDVLDEHGNKTGRYTERGRKMATGDYHLVVHIWKYNNKGEWLIDKRAPTRVQALTENAKPQEALLLPAMIV